MKILGILTLGIPFLFIACPTRAEDSQRIEPKTRLEAFQAKSGTVVFKAYEELPAVSDMGSVVVNVMEFTDVASSRKQQGILVEVHESGRAAREGRSFIDSDEIDGLLKGIDYILKVDGKATKLPSWEAIYRTKGDLTIATFNGKSGISAMVTSGNFSGVSAQLSAKKLEELRARIAAAKARIEETK